MLKLGTAMLVSSGMGEFKCFFLEYVDDMHVRCLNRLEKIIVISVNDILEVFV